jgi:hypothetical protein
MAKMTGVANGFAKNFITAKNKRYALNKIVYDLNYLVYAGTTTPLSYKDKAAIITYIFDIVAGRRTLQLKQGERAEINFSDIIFFFERRSFILKHLHAGVKKQADLN